MDETKLNKWLWIAFKIALAVAILGYITAVIIICVSKQQDIDRAVPLFCVTCFVAFCLIIRFLKLKFKDRLSTTLGRVGEVLSCTKHKRFNICAYIIVIITCLCYCIVSNIHTFDNLISIAGLVVLIGISWIISYDRQKIKWRPVIWGIVLQMVLGLLILRTAAGQTTFAFLGKQVENFQSHVLAGVTFVFGPKYADFEFIFKLMPTVIFINSAVSILFHWGLMQMLVEKIAVLMQITMGTTAAETVCTAASMFLGQPEASFTIRPYLSLMTRSELFAIMTAGFASVSADIFGLFVKYGISSSHILTAVLMSAPASLAISKIICPETEESQTKTWRQIRNVEHSIESTNVVDAAAKGATDALYIVLTIVACLIAFLSILSFLNAVLAYLCSLVQIDDVSFDKILSIILMPLVFLMGVPWEDCRIVGEVVGLKTVVNEFVGYTRLGEYIKISALSTKSQVIATYALCGFSNPMTIGVIVGAFGTLVPEKKNVISQMVVKTWIAGCITCFMTACFAGLLYDDTDQTMPFNSTTVYNTTTLSVLNVTNYNLYT